VPCVYGTRSPLRSWNPLWANLEVYSGLAHDMRHAGRLSDKLRVWFKPPGWRPPDVAARFPKPPFVLGAVERYAPAMSAWQRGLATALFIAAIGATCLVLWNAHRLEPMALAAAAAGVLGLLWLVGWVCERPPAPRTVTA
jgi:alkylglycerol monooxygenase